MSVKDTLQVQRKALLDLTYRNRLLSLPKKPSSRSITVHDEIGSQTLGMLLGKKVLSFAPLRIGSDQEQLSNDEAILDEENIVLTQPEDDELDENGLSSRHTDSKLQTKLKSEHLQRRLLEIYYEARTMLEEQGVNVLYLALGQLRFREREGSEEFRTAPLLLVPVTLDRKSARDRFVIKWNEEDPQENLSLREKLRGEFGVKLPDFPDVENLDLDSYFASVRDAVESQDGWDVIEDAIQLGFFSFAKLLMFLDLDPAKWPEGKAIDSNALVSGLLGEGFAEIDVGLSQGSSGYLDEVIPVAELKHIMDCDSSQALAIEAARRGQNLVIQGPPGTGKSQTIANLIATAVNDGKKVLFVAEKMAALEVVKRRLENVGLGAICLELHSNKANKKAVLEELGRTLKLTRPASIDVEGDIERLDQLRTRLNDHARKMHEPVGAAQLSPFQIVGALTKGLQRTGRPPYQLSGAVDWTKAEVSQRANTIRELCEYLPQVGSPASNIWRGVAHPPVMRPQAEDLANGTRAISATLAKAQECGRVLADALRMPVPSTLFEIDQYAAIGESLASAPAFDRATIASGVWSAGAGALGEAIHNGRRLGDVRGRRATQVADVAWGIDWTAQRMIIAGRGRSLFRWLNGPYREAINQLRSVASTLPKDYQARISLLDDLIAGYKAHGIVHEASAIAKSAFGEVWHGADTNWDLADSILAWVAKQDSAFPVVDLRTIAAGVEDRPVLSKLVLDVRNASFACRAEFADGVESLRLDTEVALDGVDLDRANLGLLAERTSGWPNDVDGLLGWLAYAEVSRRATDQGLGAVMDAISASSEAQALAFDQFWVAFHLEMLAEASKAYPDLPKFDGRRHEELVQQFKEWDRKRLSIAQVEAARAHFEGMPKASVGVVGTLGTLKSEIARKRGHMALRKLFKVCSSPIQATKPVFMMSPLSVAQFLEPGAIEFDILVIDEASQVEPVDALGAIARCKQIVVVGDDKQLPPTSFFSRVVGGDEFDDEEEGAQAKDLESVLSLCAAKGLPSRMLQWHYRSRHESLIAVSNKEFYEGSLFIVPSPDRERSHAGLRFHHLPHGRFDRGNSYKNHVEAVAIAQAVVDHARSRPELTLGVGAMSVRQRQAISDELELARRQHPEIEHFINRHQHEPFFVKNLENIQGDERDVILISIGYGRARNDDKMYQNFGPLNADGGHRRLNVLITRARMRCEVFTSITSDDIRVDERTKLGVIALKTFLKYAEAGDLGVPRMTGRGTDSPFEESVQDVLVKYGFQVDNQVGVAGFFIDLAIVDPERPGRYLLGIECDGASYHSAPSARDRDRLRQEILEGNGWTIHRIWSTDWFQRPKNETDRLLNVVVAAKSSQARATTAGLVVSVVPAHPATMVAIQREEVPLFPHTDAVPISQAYKQASFVPGNANLQPHEVPVGSMAYTVQRIIEIEGPIHEEEIVARVRDLWGLGRAGSRIQAVVREALAHASRKGQFAIEGDCYHLKDRAVVVRDRSQAESRTLKKPELLPPQEIREAIVGLVCDAHGVHRDEVTTVVSRMLGFQATSQQLRERIERQIELLVINGKLRLHSGVLNLPTASSKQPR
jgi:very-short-patch-repair endonuclease